MDPEDTSQLFTVLCNTESSDVVRQRAGEVLFKRLGRSRSTWTDLKIDGQMKALDQIASLVKTLTPNNGGNANMLLTIGKIIGNVLGKSPSSGVTDEWKQKIWKMIQQFAKSSDMQIQRMILTTLKGLGSYTSDSVNHIECIHISLVLSKCAIERYGEDMDMQAMNALIDCWGSVIKRYGSYASMMNVLRVFLQTLLLMTHSFANRLILDPAASTNLRPFEIVKSFAIYFPELLAPQLTVPMNYICNTISIKEVSDEIRCHAIDALEILAIYMERDLIKIKMWNFALSTLIKLLAVEPPSPSFGQEYFEIDKGDFRCPEYRAGLAITKIASYISDHRSREEALDLIKPQFKGSPSTLHRMSVQLFMSRIFKGFKQPFGKNVLKQFIAVILKGTNDSSQIVRRSGFYAMTVFVEFAHPETTLLTKELFPIFCNFFDGLRIYERVAIDCHFMIFEMFSALELYIQTLTPLTLLDHINPIMTIMLFLAEPINSLELQQYSMNIITILAKWTKKDFDSHFEAVAKLAMPLIRSSANDEDQLSVLLVALKLWIELAEVSPAKFALEGPKLFTMCIKLKDEMEIPGVRARIYRVLALITASAPEELGPRFSSIMEELLLEIKELPKGINYNDKRDSDTESDGDDDSNNAASVDNGVNDNNFYNVLNNDNFDNVDPVVNGDNVAGLVKSDDGDDDSRYNNISEVGHTDDDDDTDDNADHNDDNEADNDTVVDGETTNCLVHGGHGDQTESASSVETTPDSIIDNFIHGYNEAMNCLKLFAIHNPVALIPYLTELMKSDFVTWESFETYTQIALLAILEGHCHETIQRTQQLMPNMILFLLNNSQGGHVLIVIKCFTELMIELGGECVGDGKSVAYFLRSALNNKLKCQPKFPSGDDDDLLNCSYALQTAFEITHATITMMSIFGQILGKNRFPPLFRWITKKLMNKVRNLNPSDGITKDMVICYKVTYRCLNSLGVAGEQYYDTLCTGVLNCLNDDNSQTRKITFYLIDALLQHAHEQRNAESIIFATFNAFVDVLDFDSHLELSECEKICVVLCRMAYMDAVAINVDMLMSALYLHLPFQHEHYGYKEVLEGVRNLFSKKHLTNVRQYFQAIREMLLVILEKNHLNDNNGLEIAIELLQHIQEDVDGEFYEDTM